MSKFCVPGFRFKGQALELSEAWWIKKLSIREFTDAKILRTEANTQPSRGYLAVRQELGAALTDQTDEAAETLGRIDYKYYLDQWSDWLAEQGEIKEAKSVQSGLLQTLSARKVLDRVLKDLEARGAAYV